MDENDISRIRPFHNELSSLCLHLAFIRAFVTLRLTLKNVLFASQEISRFFNKITVRVKLDLFGCLGLCCSSCKTQLTEQKGEIIKTTSNALTCLVHFWHVLKVSITLKTCSFEK